MIKKIIKIISALCIFLFSAPSKAMLLRRLSRTTPYTTSTIRSAPSAKPAPTPSKASVLASWIQAKIRSTQETLNKYNPFTHGQKRYYSTAVPVQNIANKPITTSKSSDARKESDAIIEQLNALKPEEQTGKSISIAGGDERFYAKIPKDSNLRKQIQSFLEKNTIHDIENVFSNLIELYEGQEFIFGLMQQNSSFTTKIMPLIEKYFTKIGPIKYLLFSLDISEPNASQIMDNLKVRYVSGFRTVDISDMMDDLPQYLPKNSLQFMKVLSHIYRETNDQTLVFRPVSNRLVMDYLKDREKFNDLLLQTLEQRSDLSTIFLETLETKNYFKDNRNLLARLLTKKPHYSTDILKAMNRPLSKL